MSPLCVTQKSTNNPFSNSHVVPDSNDNTFLTPCTRSFALHPRTASCLPTMQAYDESNEYDTTRADAVVTLAANPDHTGARNAVDYFL